MTLLFADPLDQYAAVTQINRLWTSVGSGGNAPTLNTTGGRFGGSAIEMNGATQEMIKTLTTSVTYYSAFSFKISALPVSLIYLIRHQDGASDQCSLILDTSGNFRLYRGATLVATSAGTIQTGVWMWVEFRSTVDPTSGVMECRINGSVVVTFSGNTRATANSQVTRINVRPNLTPGVTLTYDDIIVNNAQGSTNNGYLGDSRIEWLKPDADTAQADFTPLGGGDNYAEVDDSGADDDTTYNYSSTNGHRDLFDIGNLTVTPTTIHGIVALTLAKKTDAGTRNGRNVIKSSTVATGTDTALSTSYTYLADVWETDPNTAAAWTPSAVNSLQAGYEISA